MRMWFEARHFSWHWCYLLFILVPVSWKNQSHSKKNVVAKQASETFDLERSCRFCFCGQNVQQNCKRTSNDIENVENGERTIDSGEYVSGLSRKTFVNIPRHWNVSYVDFNDLTLFSFLRVILCAFFLHHYNLTASSKSLYWITYCIKSAIWEVLGCWPLNFF